MKMTTRVEFTVNWSHIALARNNSAKITPVTLALLEQTSFRRAEFADGTLILTSAAGARVVCPAPPELALFLERFARGEAIQPATFTLELPKAV